MAADANPQPGEVKKLGIAGGELFQESLTPGAEARQIMIGSTAVTADDKEIGEVTRVRPNCVVVQRRGGDLYVPFSAVLEARESRVVVNTLENQLDRLGWNVPPAG